MMKLQSFLPIISVTRARGAVHNGLTLESVKLACIIFQSVSCLHENMTSSSQEIIQLMFNDAFAVCCENGMKHKYTLWAKIKTY
jgi:hypothetical protein